MDLQSRCKSCFEVITENSAACPSCGYIEGKELQSSAFLKPGTILENKYLIGGVLGQGGFGITYLAWDINLNIKLAIKEYFPVDLANRIPGQNDVSAYSGSRGNEYDYGIEKFLQEARTLAGFEGHPNIVSIRDFFKANGTAYFVMYFVEGITLKSYLKEAGGIMSFEEALKLIIPVLDALREVHSADILHRDISPDNIFINKKGQVILLDFGAARQSVGGKGKNLSIILKPGYAPEEQYRSSGVQGPWTDIYATAATLYHLITGQLPPESLERLSEDRLIKPSEAGVTLSENEEEAVLKALAVQASDRYQTTEEFRQALLGDRRTFTPHPSPGIEQIAKSKTQQVVSTKAAKKKLSPTVLVGIVTVLVTGIAISLFWASGAFSSNRIKEGIISHDGGQYSGQLYDGLPHGSGTWTHPDGLIYDGEWRSGKADGYGIMSWPDGDRYEGEWKEDMISGQGTYYSSDGSIYRGGWFNDMRHGYGVITYADGDMYEGEWKADLMYGQGIFYWNDGRKYEGEFKDNMRDGFGLMVWPDGTSYEGDWQSDIMDGYGILSLPDGDKYKGEFARDKMHGQGKFISAAGIVIEGLWQDGNYIAGN